MVNFGQICMYDGHMTPLATALAETVEIPPGQSLGGGDPGLAALAAEPLAILRPASQTVPIIFASPHSGRLYPLGFSKFSRLDSLSLRRSEDAFVDELFDAVPLLGAPLLTARFPRVFVDANRGATEIDPAMFDVPPAAPTGPRTTRVAAGLGVIPRVVRDGLEIYGTKLPAHEANFRLEYFYRPYHAALSSLIAETLDGFGVAIIVDCHSMPPPGRGRDIVVGDCYGESAGAELIQSTLKILASVGFSVARNAPYAGGYTTSFYGKPERGVHAIQIEISRALYLDEARLEKTAGFGECRRRLGLFSAQLAEAAKKMATPRRGGQV